MRLRSRTLSILAAMDVWVIPQQFLASPRLPFLGKGRMHPFVPPSIVFWLHMALQCQSSMLSNFLVFHTSGSISSSTTAFLFIIFLSTESSSCVNCPSLISNCLLIIFMIGSCVTFGGFPSKFLKCCFHSCIHSSWLVAFSLAFRVLFLLFTSFTVYHTILDWLSSSESLILIWFCMYAVHSFRYMLANSFFAFLSFRALVLVGFFQLHLEAVSHLHAFFLTANVSHDTLDLALCLDGMHSAAASK